jgi:hypothetical protein
MDTPDRLAAVREGSGAHMRLVTSAVAAAVLVVAGVAAASSVAGAATESGSQILSSAISASKGASSGTVEGTVREGSKSTTLDLTASTSDRGKGSVTVNGQQVNIVRLGSTVYMSGSRQFWEQSVNSSAAEMFANKWIEGPITNKNFASLGQYLDYPTLMGSLLPGGNAQSNRVGTTTFDGQRVIVLKKTSGASTATAYVAATGRPYLLYLAQTGGSSTGSLTFSGYDADVNPSAPRGALSYEQLTHGGNGSASSG